MPGMAQGRAPAPPIAPGGAFGQAPHSTERRWGGASEMPAIELTSKHTASSAALTPPGACRSIEA